MFYGLGFTALSTCVKVLDFSPCHTQFACTVHATRGGDIVLEPSTATAQYNVYTHIYS